ncbi:cytochrome c oxidase assembly protein [Gilvimarinus sp. F26214L]|uniref:cytochrome c oxidase assembly protein n=1 Tax=Gilvimarinus sp. DZF01 TaxID=3461371 RepID=UPI004045BC22
MAEAGVRKMAAKLVVLAIAMFAFAIYVLPPIYDVFCDVLGIDGQGDMIAADNSGVQVDESRTVRVTFMATNNEEMPWEFRPNTAVVELHPGEVATVSYHAKNTTSDYMVSRAVPNFIPTSAATHFKKVECFCFENQPLAPGESADMALQFYLDPALPKHITNVTASYTIFDITEAANGEPQVSQR